MSAPHYIDDAVTLYAGDCLAVLPTLPDNSVDAVVTDPPYALGFMGRDWDTFGLDVGRGAQARKQRAAEVTPTGQGHSTSAGPYLASGVDSLRGAGAPFQRWCQQWAAECLRVLKPGGHLLAFGGTRTWHRLAVAIEDAGFEIRDTIAWLYGSGFPKSLDVSKAIDKAAGAERPVVGPNLTRHGGGLGVLHGGGIGAEVGDITAPATADAQRWQGWGTALKPAWESVVVAQKNPTVVDRIGSRLDDLEQQCKRNARDAGRSSAPTHPASPGATTGTAPDLAATQPEGAAEKRTATGRGADSSAATDTSASEWTAETCSNIVTSWKRCWVAISELRNTSTTSTTSETTTDLTTLWSCLSKITDASTHLTDPTSPDGLSSLARIVDSLFAAAWLSLSATHALTATEPATSPTPQVSRGARGQLEPIVVARRPLIGTVAANVLAHGTGALNIAACRIGDERIFIKGGGARYDAEGNKTFLPSKEVNEERAGRWPANVALDETAAAALDHMSGELHGAGSAQGPQERWNPSAAEGWGNFGSGPGVAGARFGDTGGASRFFFVTNSKDDRIEACGNANTAGENSSLQSELGVSAPSDAATSASLAGNSKSPSTAPSTSATETGSKPNGESDTPPIPSTAERSSPALPQPRHTPTSSPVSGAEAPRLTDTTTTTASPSTFAGSADPVTSSTTPKSKAPGGQALPLDSLAERFIYTAKAGSDERVTVNGISHPTVKPLSLLRWLVRLVTPPGGTILEPFAGSGTTVEAALLEGFRCIAIEREPDYLPLITQRLNRRRNPVAYLTAAGEDLGLFDEDEPA